MNWFEYKLNVSSTVGVCYLKGILSLVLLKGRLSLDSLTANLLFLFKGTWQ
jgi:hypothetical protein